MLWDEFLRNFVPAEGKYKILQCDIPKDTIISDSIESDRVISEAASIAADKRVAEHFLATVTGFQGQFKTHSHVLFYSYHLYNALKILEVKECDRSLGTNVLIMYLLFEGFLVSQPRTILIRYTTSMATSRVSYSYILMLLCYSTTTSVNYNFLNEVGMDAPRGRPINCCVLYISIIVINHRLHNVLLLVYKPPHTILVHLIAFYWSLITNYFLIILAWDRGVIPYSKIAFSTRMQGIISKLKETCPSTTSVIAPQLLRNETSKCYSSSCKKVMNCF